MSRPKLNYPENQDSWNKLPQEFLDYLTYLDEYRTEKVSNKKIDPLYPTYDYEWEVDDDLALRIILEYWNEDKELPGPNTILDEINDAMAEAAYDDYVSSYYSY